MLLAGASGNGKSTTAWALLHRGFQYLSDELAPLDLSAMTVHAFPHALCLKHVGVQRRHQHQRIAHELLDARLVRFDADGAVVIEANRSVAEESD